MLGGFGGCKNTENKLMTWMGQCWKAHLITNHWWVKKSLTKYMVFNLLFFLFTIYFWNILTPRRKPEVALVRAWQFLYYEDNWIQNLRGSVWTTWSLLPLLNLPFPTLLPLSSPHSWKKCFSYCQRDWQDVTLLWDPP